MVLCGKANSAGREILGVLAHTHSKRIMYESVIVIHNAQRRSSMIGRNFIWI